MVTEAGAAGKVVETPADGLLRVARERGQGAWAWPLSGPAGRVQIG